jgi:hypothetical protein
MSIGSLRRIIDNHSKYRIASDRQFFMGLARKKWPSWHQSYGIDIGLCDDPAMKPKGILHQPHWASHQMPRSNKINERKPEFDGAVAPDRMMICLTKGLTLF